MRSQDPSLRAKRLAQALVEANIDADSLVLAKQLLARIKLPMSKVLEKVPGDSIAAKSRTLEVTRATYYSWWGGLTRPKRDQAKKLSQITGYPANLIAGDPTWDGSDANTNT